MITDNKDIHIFLLLSKTSIGKKTKCLKKLVMDSDENKNDARYSKKKGNSIRDARTPQSGEIVFNTMRYRSSETVQRSGYFNNSVSYIKVQIMFK